MEGGGMTSNPKPEHETCPHDGHLLNRTGKCWYCGGIYPAGKPALTVVESEPQVEVETSMGSVEATISVQKVVDLGSMEVTAEEWSDD